MSYVDFHPTIHKMGDEECLAAIINGDITEFEDMSLTNTNTQTLSNCQQLSRVSLPLLQLARGSFCYNCDSLVEVNTPRLHDLWGGEFDDCDILKSISFNVSLVFYNINFRNTSLETLILRDVRSISNLSNINVFENTPIANGTGYIYVPKKMLDGTDGIAAYENVTNWSAFAGQFRCIEDYPEITGGR